MPKTFNTFFCFVFIVAGAILLTANLIIGSQTIQFAKNAFSAKGKVVKLNSGSSHPQIAFTTADGQEIQYPQNGLIGGYAEGDEVTVLYEPQNPKNACLDTFGALWGFNLSGIILSLAFICIGVFRFLYPNSKLITPNI